MQVVSFFSSFSKDGNGPWLAYTSKQAIGNRQQAIDNWQLLWQFQIKQQLVQNGFNIYGSKQATGNWQ